MSFNARIPKPYDQLPDKDKEKIRAFVRQVALEAAEVEIQRIARIMLDIYMKMACVMLHDMPDGWGEKRLRMFLGNHKRVFARQFKLVERDEQLKYLNGRMAKIFKKDGFPQDFVDEILGKVEVKGE